MGLMYIYLQWMVDFYGFSRRWIYLSSHGSVGWGSHESPSIAENPHPDVWCREYLPRWKMATFKIPYGAFENSVWKISLMGDYPRPIILYLYAQRSDGRNVIKYCVFFGVALFSPTRYPVFESLRVHEKLANTQCLEARHWIKKWISISGWKKNAKRFFADTKTPPFSMNTYTWNLKHLFINGCFNWMIPNLYIGNGCSTKKTCKTGCLGYQVTPTKRV